MWENCDNNKGCLDCIDCDVAYECGLADIVINVMSDKNILFYVTIFKMSIYLNNNMWMDKLRRKDKAFDDDRITINITHS